MTHFPGLGEVVITYPEDAKVTRLPHPLVWDFTKYCRQVKPKREFAHAEDFSPEKTHEWTDFMIVLDYLPEQEDFSYRHYGKGIAEISGFDMTGKCVSDFDSEVGRMFQRQYLKCITERVMIHSEHFRVHSRTNCKWMRSICPAKDGEDISIHLVNVPVPQKDED